MTQNQESYDNEFKAQAVKFAQETGRHKAAKELGIPNDIIYCWIKAFKEGRLSADETVYSPMTTLSLSGKLTELRKRVKEQDKEIRRLEEENEFLEEASAFFAVNRHKSARNRDWCLLQSKLMTARLRVKFLFTAESFMFPDKHSINI